MFKNRYSMYVCVCVCVREMAKSSSEKTHFTAVSTSQHCAFVIINRLSLCRSDNKKIGCLNLSFEETRNIFYAFFSKS